MFYVYEFRDNTGKPFYVGKGSKQRMQSHVARAKSGIQSHFYKKLRKLWRDGHIHTAVIVFETLFEEMAYAEEVRLIAYYGRSTLTNGTDGGDGVRNPSEEAKKRMIAPRLGKVVSEATRNRQRLAALKKPPMTAETKAKISAKAKGRKQPWARELALRNLSKMSGKGRPWTEQQRQLFRKARLGHAVTQETRDKISKSKKGSIPWNKKPIQQPQDTVLTVPKITASGCTSAECQETNT
jgi:hypothetical protein